MPFNRSHRDLSLNPNVVKNLLCRPWRLDTLESFFYSFHDITAMLQNEVVNVIDLYALTIGTAKNDQDDVAAALQLFPLRGALGNFDS